MRSSVLLLILAFSALVLGGIVPLSRPVSLVPNPNDIFKKVQFQPLNTLSYAEPQVEVDLSQLTVGYHARAYYQVQALYPLYGAYRVSRCRYATLGLIRFYTFTFQLPSSAPEARTAVQTQTTDDSQGQTSANEDGYMQVSVEWAQQDPRISSALNSVLRSNWKIIAGNPLSGCWTRPFGGLFAYRFRFREVVGVFEYHENQQKVTLDENYFADKAPIFSVGETENPEDYINYYVGQIYDHPAWPTIEKLLVKELGFVDKDWIINFKGSIVKDKESNSFKIMINFKPFLVKQTFEAYYYGSIEKAALLKIDEQVFTEGRSYENWQNIQDFSRYNAFHEADQYILSQFTWLRFYKVVSAYSALHKKGRFVRLVYQGLAENNIDPQNQINIICYIDQVGKYYIERNDFLATSLGSYGRNDWVSLFVQTPDATKAEYYQRIVKFFNSIYPKFWSANQLVDIKFKKDLHVVKFKNPTNLHYSVLNINGEQTEILNKFNWTLLEGQSPLVGRLENYVRGKNNVSRIMFIHYFKPDNGTHFEVSYLNSENQYRAAYILYIEATDVFTDDKDYFFSRNTFSSDPLPADVKASIETYLSASDESILAVAGFVSLSPTSFAIIGISQTGRWQITVQWQDSQWVVVSKQPYNDGYFLARGYPSSSVASCTSFLRRLYPNDLGQGWLYASIETKNVGVNLYSRLVYQVGNKFVEAVVGQTYSVDNSHVLYSYRFLSGMRFLADYGYGTHYDYSYNIPQKYLYSDQSAPKSTLTRETAPAPPQPTSTSKGSCPFSSRRDIFSNQCIVVF